MKNDLHLTIDNWKSEHRRLEAKYKKVTDKTSLEARGLLDHIVAVRAIIKEIEDKDKRPE